MLFDCTKQKFANDGMKIRLQFLIRLRFMLRDYMIGVKTLQYVTADVLQCASGGILILLDKESRNSGEEVQIVVHLLATAFSNWKVLALAVILG
jgi:hypothetical protein